MADHPRPNERPGTGAENIPPGATRQALDRPTNPGGGPPGSGAGPRHMSGDPGDGNEFSDAIDRHREDDPTQTEIPALSDENLRNSEEGPPYSGSSGGAVGGAPAEGRSAGGNVHRGIAPGGEHRGDSTVGSPPTRKGRGRASR